MEQTPSHCLKPPMQAGGLSAHRQHGSPLHIGLPMRALRHDYMYMHGRDCEMPSLSLGYARLRITEEPGIVPAVDFVFVRWQLLPAILR